MAIPAHTFVGIGKSVRRFIRNIAAFTATLPHGRRSRTAGTSFVGASDHGEPTEHFSRKVGRLLASAVR